MSVVFLKSQTEKEAQMNKGLVLNDFVPFFFLKSH